MCRRLRRRCCCCGCCSNNIVIVFSIWPGWNPFFWLAKKGIVETCFPGRTLPLCTVLFFSSCPTKTNKLTKINGNFLNKIQKRISFLTTRWWISNVVFHLLGFFRVCPSTNEVTKSESKSKTKTTEF